MNALKTVLKGRTGKYILFGLAVLAALRLYLVQEVLAALFIFSILFAVVAAIAVVLFLLDFASQRTVAWAGPRSRSVVHVGRRMWMAAAEASRKQLHRLRSQTAQ